MNAESHAFGIHWWQSRLGCQRRLIYEAEVGDGGEDADFGTHVHSWTAWMRGGSVGPMPALSIERPNRSCSERELVDRYAALSGGIDFGRPVLIEQRLEMLTPDGLCLRGTLDAVVELDEGACNRIQSARGVRLQAGRYLVDDKTKRQNAGTMVAQFRQSPQFAAYVALWNTHHPAEPLEGVLINIMFRYTESRPEQFMLLSMPMPDEAAFAAVWSLIRDAHRNVRERGENHCNPIHCFDWNRACPGVDAGCDRINP